MQYQKKVLMDYAYLFIHSTVVQRFSLLRVIIKDSPSKYAIKHNKIAPFSVFPILKTLRYINL